MSEENQLNANYLRILRTNIGCDNKFMFANQKLCKRLIEAEKCFEKMAIIYETEPEPPVKMDCRTLLKSYK